MCSINKSAHTKKFGDLFNDPRKLDLNFSITTTGCFTIVKTKP